MFYKGEYHIIGENIKKSPFSKLKVIELVQPWSNDGYFVLNDKIFSIEPGCVFVLNAFETHCVNTPDINKFCRNKIIIDYDYLLTLFDKINIPESTISSFQNNPVFYFNIQDRSPYELDLLFKKAAEAYDDPSNIGFAEFITATIETFLFLFRKSEKKIPIFIDNNKPINKAMEYINNNLYNENLSLDDICENCHTNKYYLCHTFKETTGISVMKYIKERRINRAKQLLIETDIKICDIGSMVGYPNASLFCKIFKQDVGCPPLKYRNIK